MIKNKIHIILIILIVIPTIMFGQYTLDNTGGKINNLGTIRVNTGETKALPDTLGGRIEFLQNGSTTQQSIPNIVYFQLVISNQAKKIINDDRDGSNNVKNLIVRDSLIVSDSTEFTTRWIGLNAEDVHAKASVTNTAKFTGKKDMVLSGTDKTQDLIGNGSFSRIRVENPFGVEVRGGGFQLSEQLNLKKGELRNSAESNFIMADSTLLIRHVGSSIAHEPILDKQISVHYEGTGDLTTGPEIPKQKDALKNLNVKVSGQLTLDRNVTVVDTLEVGAMISAVSDTLTLQGRTNPIFSGGPDIEIAGNFRRNTLTAGDTILLNSPNIWVYFEDAASMGNLRNLVSTILPMTFHSLPLADTKVRRAYTLFGTDTDGNEVTEGFAMDFGFKYREINDPGKDESNGLTASELVLQRWLDNEWIDIAPKQPISLDFGTGWATGMVQKLNHLGQFAIGMPSASLMAFTFQASFYLEGPYIPGSQGFMKHELWSRNLIELADLATYPTNLDTKLTPDFLTQIPDSVVDIVVLEFRTDRNAPPSIVKTGFLRYDGTFVDRNGKPGIELRKGVDIDTQGAQYHIVVRQRNHSSVITDMPVDINLETEGVVYNLSDPSMVEGGAASLKLVYSGENGKKVFALKGGFLADDAEGLNNQLNMLSYYTRNIEHQSTFDYFTRVGYLNADYNLSGIVNTKDFNVTWNNRGLK